MKLAASNIAWAREQNEDVARMLRELGFQGVELAPTAIWSEPLKATPEEIRVCREWWESRGLPIVAMQALLFGRADLTIFDDAATRAATREYLSGIIRLGGQLGAKALVFGSPKNRKVGARPRAEAEEIACEFFHALGEVALQHGTTLCVEPNPTVYACDFVTTSREGLELVRKVGSAGFCLHLDAGGITLSQESFDDRLLEALRSARHFHASESQLAPLGSGTVDHPRFVAALREVHYGHWVSVEMRSLAEDAGQHKLRAALTAARDVYGA
ncbi:sugar or sugar nucleotide oxidoreductase [Cystobacter fuscus DSM 2262]|uniref:Sugar or sugar nucleotide oxidoreductase n=1 Tax=Cystobacter fuscus (strain ATCC 25194 / DSM 2262 / NBRC 100088 / M29) TaxID=1242864 RepID=S9PDK0_CYSF2|nr:sugar phosphate isomerase/epimerase [Cystobacter fuscus]EPX60392.1 sugar or sugar nucleotide oxidoreductase [Cystobacter fuscus DSM 2262]